MATIAPITKISPRLIRVLGCNPGPMTLQGTNTYIIGTGKRRILLDASDENVPEYIGHLKKVISDERILINDIIVSHWHHDHIGGVDEVLDVIENKDSCKVWKYPRSDAPETTLRNANIHHLKHGQKFSIEGATLEVIHTPGHTTDHVVLVLHEDNSLFSADCILGEGTTVFEDLYEYMKSLQVIQDAKPSVIYPGHGNIILEERKANGRFIAVCVALFLVFLGIYHAWLRRTAVVAGVIVPVLIMLLYTAWVLYSAKRHKRKMMLLRNAASLNSVNCLDKDSVAPHSDVPLKTKENLQTPNSNSQKTGSVRYSNINEIPSTSSRSHSKDTNLRKHEQHDRSRSGAANKSSVKVLPRQQSSITPMSLKEIPQQRRLSLDPHMAHMIVKNELDKDRHGSLRSVENAKGNKKPKSNKEKVGFTIY